MPVNCSICLSIFKEPVSLPCGHIYCTKCLADHVNAPNNQGMTSTCPTCRTGFSIVTPDLTYLPKKYHQYIVPSVRRVYLDASQDTALQEKLKQAEARLKLQKKNEEDLLKRCEGLKAAVHAHQTGETKANQKVRQLEANLVTVEDELYEDIRSLHARVEELEEENYKTQIKLDNLRARHKAMEDKAATAKQQKEEKKKLAKCNPSEPLPTLVSISKAAFHANSSTHSQQLELLPPAMRPVKPLPKLRIARRARSASPPPNFNDRTKRPRLSEGARPANRSLPP